MGRAWRRGGGLGADETLVGIRPGRLREGCGGGEAVLEPGWGGKGR